MVYAKGCCALRAWRCINVCMCGTCVCSVCSVCVCTRMCVPVCVGVICGCGEWSPWLYRDPSGRCGLRVSFVDDPLHVDDDLFDVLTHPGEDIWAQDLSM